MTNEEKLKNHGLVGHSIISTYGSAPLFGDMALQLETFIDGKSRWLGTVVVHYADKNNKPDSEKVVMSAINYWRDSDSRCVDYVYDNTPKSTSIEDRITRLENEIKSLKVRMDANDGV